MHLLHKNLHFPLPQKPIEKVIERFPRRKNCIEKVLSIGCDSLEYNSICNARTVHAVPKERCDTDTATYSVHKQQL